MSEFKPCLTHLTTTPWGKVCLAANAKGLCGLWFLGQKYFPEKLPAPITQAADKQSAAQVHIEAALTWLQNYIQGNPLGQKASPLPYPLFDLSRGTPFQQTVWAKLLTIPYGAVCSYGELAQAIGRPGAARAVGSAVGRNPVSILIPCHRVIGQQGSLTGYAGGLDRKKALLYHEATSC